MNQKKVLWSHNLIQRQQQNNNNKTTSTTTMEEVAQKNSFIAYTVRKKNIFLY